MARPRHFQADEEENRAIGSWLLEVLRSFGYEAQVQGASRNVVAFPRGLSSFMNVTVVGAHYDSVPESPGADDNASAVAALLGCAAALSGVAHPVIFVAFNREEEGFIGSGEFVEDFVRPRKIEVGCAHILEMVGYASEVAGSQHRPTGLPIPLPERGNFLGLLANDQSAEVMRKVLALSGAYTAALPVTGLTIVPGAERVFPVLARSDHVPFWARDIPAVMWTDTAEFRNPNYHRPTDTPETLNYGFLEQVTKLLTAAIR